jgi:hypothetical protein
MRLIDKDTLGVSRCNPDVFKVPGRAEGWNSLLDIVNSAPTIDAVPVVRCRECKHYHSDTGWCDQLSYFQTSDGEPCSPAESMDWKMFQENDYCSMGQRKEAAHEVLEP